MKGTNVNDNRYLNCFLGQAAELDVDWALWALTGSYYLRDGVVGFDETYGIYNWDWNEVRNTSLLQKISTLQYSFRGNSKVLKMDTASFLTSQFKKSRIAEVLTYGCRPGYQQIQPVVELFELAKTN